MLFVTHGNAPQFSLAFSSLLHVFSFHCIFKIIWQLKSNFTALEWLRKTNNECPQQQQQTRWKTYVQLSSDCRNTSTFPPLSHSLFLSLFSSCRWQFERQQLAVDSTQLTQIYWGKERDRKLERKRLQERDREREREGTKGRVKKCWLSRTHIKQQHQQQKYFEFATLCSSTKFFLVFLAHVCHAAVQPAHVAVTQQEGASRRDSYRQRETERQQQLSYISKFEPSKSLAP